MSCGWALPGHSAVGHCRYTLRGGWDNIDFSKSNNLTVEGTVLFPLHLPQQFDSGSFAIQLPGGHEVLRGTPALRVARQQTDGRLHPGNGGMDPSSSLCYPKGPRTQLMRF